MNVYLETMETLMGSLSTLDGSAIIQEVMIEIDSITAKKLSTALKNGKPTNENQKLFFKSISFSKGGLDAFTKGQSGIVKDRNRYIMTTNGKNPARFKGIFRTLIKGSDGYDYACDVVIGNIDFNIGDKDPVVTGDTVLFERIEGMIYPYGDYRAVVVQEDEE